MPEDAEVLPSKAFSFQREDETGVDDPSPGRLINQTSGASERCKR